MSDEMRVFLPEPEKGPFNRLQAYEKTNVKIREPICSVVQEFNDLWLPKSNKMIKLFDDGEPINAKDYIEDIEEFDWQEHLLNEIFTKLDCSISYIGGAVYLIDSFYHTRIPNISKAVILIRKKIEESDLLNKIRCAKSSKDATDCVELLGCVLESKEYYTKEHHPYSFATKFCNRINPDVFPIYDRYVIGLLDYYMSTRKLEDNKIPSDIIFRKKHLQKTSLGHYDNLIKVFESFKKEYGLDKSGYNYKQIDVFLWTYGKILDSYKSNHPHDVEIADCYPVPISLSFQKNKNRTANTQREIPPEYRCCSGGQSD